MKIYSILALAIISSISYSIAGESKSYKCNYNKYADSKGLHKVKERFELTFLIDKETGKSYIVGNQGSEEVIAYQNVESKSISFIEITGTRNVMTTTIDSKMKSVHSRHTVMMGELVESQFYGNCE